MGENTFRYMVGLGLAVVLAACTSIEERSTMSSQAIGQRGADLFGMNTAADGYPGGAEIAELGARWVRMELSDETDASTMLSSAARDKLTTTLADYHARGIKVLVIVDYATYPGFKGFSCSRESEHWDEYRERWLARIEDTARIFGDGAAEPIDAWEVWNEEDQPILACGRCGEKPAGYNPGVPAEKYGPLLAAAAARIKASSSAPIVMGGLTGLDTSYVAKVKSVSGIPVHAVSTHPYGGVPDMSFCPNPGEDLHCEWGTLGAAADDLHAQTGLPVWVTEFGIRTTDTKHQARYLSAAYRTFASRPFVEHAFYFGYSDAMVYPFGVRWRNGAKKGNAFAAYQRLAMDADVEDTGVADDPEGLPQGTPPGDPGYEPPPAENVPLPPCP